MYSSQQPATTLFAAIIIMAQAARHAAKAARMLEALERARRTGDWAVLAHAATKLGKYQPDQGKMPVHMGTRM
jgi:hypothetical protein